MIDNLAQLRAKYTALDTAEPKDEDLIRSLRLHRVDIAIEVGGPVTETSLQVVTWITVVRRIEHQIEASGALPRENRRRSTTGEDRPLLGPWLTRQRNAATRQHHCSYQTRRLELLPDFDWTPLITAWEAQFQQYKTFVQDHRRAPDHRQPAERAFAQWAKRQRSNYRNGVLTSSQIEQLKTLSIWKMGPRR